MQRLRTVAAADVSADGRVTPLVGRIDVAKIDQQAGRYEVRLGASLGPWYHLLVRPRAAGRRVVCSVSVNRDQVDAPLLKIGMIEAAESDDDPLCLDAEGRPSWERRYVTTTCDFEVVVYAPT